MRESKNQLWSTNGSRTDISDDILPKVTSTKHGCYWKYKSMMEHPQNE